MMKGNIRGTGNKDEGLLRIDDIQTVGVVRSKVVILMYYGDGDVDCGSDVSWWLW